LIGKYKNFDIIDMADTLLRTLSSHHTSLKLSLQKVFLRYLSQVW
jgi:hypothetical protein